VCLASEPVVESNDKSIAERIPAFGIICAIIGVTMTSLASLVVKLLTDLHSVEILVIRYLQNIFYKK